MEVIAPFPPVYMHMGGSKCLWDVYYHRNGSEIY